MPCQWSSGSSDVALKVSEPAAPATHSASEAARGWMGESFHGAYLMHKRGEAALMAGLTEVEQCARYAETY